MLILCTVIQVLYSSCICIIIISWISSETTLFVEKDRKQKKKVTKARYFTCLGIFNRYAYSEVQCMHVFHLFYLDIRVVVCIVFKEGENKQRESNKLWEFYEGLMGKSCTNDATVGLVGFAFLSHNSDERMS